MSDKKSNVLGRILYILKQKKEDSDIISQADKVIEGYISAKNKIIHRKYSSHRRTASSAVIAALISATALSILIIKSILFG